MKNLLRYLLFILILGSLYAQSNLPACQGGEVSKWNNCFGSITTSSGHRYVGDFKNGKYNGQGEIQRADGNKYIGEFKDGFFWGQGSYTLLDGTQYIGEFNSPNGKYGGKGMLTRINGEKYIGEMKDGFFNGKGTFIRSNGEKYVGEFKEGYFSGQGVLYSSSGSVKNQGLWSAGNLVESKSLQPLSKSQAFHTSNEYDGKWNGTISCSAYSSNATALGPFTRDNDYDVSNGRITAKYLATGGKNTLTSEGNIANGIATVTINGTNGKDNWIYQFNGKPTSAGRIVFTGNMVERGVKERDCTMVFTSTAPSVGSLLFKEANAVVSTNDTKSTSANSSSSEVSVVTQSKNISNNLDIVTNTRKALVIGNDQYKFAPKLVNAREDAKTIAGIACYERWLRK